MKTQLLSLFVSLLVPLGVSSITNANETTERLTNHEIEHIEGSVAETCKHYTSGYAQGMNDYRKALVKLLSKHERGLSSEAWKAFVDLSPTPVTPDKCFNNLRLDKIKHRATFKLKLKVALDAE